MKKLLTAVVTTLVVLVGAGTAQALDNERCTVDPLACIYNGVQVVIDDMP